MKKVAVLGAGLYNKRVYQLLVSAGYYVLAIDGNENAAAAEYASEFVHLNFSDKEKLYAFCTEKKVDAVMPLNDWGTIPAAYVTGLLGLKGITVETALRCTDKGLMRDCWKQNNVPVPNYFVFHNYLELQKNIESIGFPCVIKPTDGGGSGRGISVVKNINELEWAYNFALPFVRNNRFIAEQFVEGTELTIESITVDGEVHILAISDKEKPDLRTRVATSLNYPANISTDQLLLVESTVREAVKSLGINIGMAHTEVILNGEDIFLVETGARGGGGHIFHTIIEAVSGINAPVVLAELLCGENLELSPIQKNGAIYRFFNPEHGILKTVNNVDSVANWPGVLDVGIVKKVGDEVGNLRNSLDRAGFVITSGQNREEAIALADKVENTIEILIEPLP